MNKIIKILVVGGIGATVGCIVLAAIAVVSTPTPPSAATKQNVAVIKPQPTAPQKTIELTAPPPDTPPTQQPPASNGIEVSGKLIQNCKRYSIYKPVDGKELQGVTVTLRNNTNKPLSVNPLNFRAVSKDGFVYPPDLASCEGQIDTVNIAPGQAIRGVVGFHIDPGAEIVSVQFTELLGDPVSGPVTK